MFLLNEQQMCSTPHGHRCCFHSFKPTLLLPNSVTPGSSLQVHFSCIIFPLVTWIIKQHALHILLNRYTIVEGPTKNSGAIEFMQRACVKDIDQLRSQKPLSHRIVYFPSLTEMVKLDDKWLTALNCFMLARFDIPFLSSCEPSVRPPINFSYHLLRLFPVNW